LTAILLAIETKSLLLGESADPRVVRGIRRLTQEHSGVRGVNEILTMHMSPEQVLANISVAFEKDITAEAVEDTIADIDKQIRKRYPEIKRIFIEAESPTRQGQPRGNND